MSDISDLESRISAAMDRISRGLETLDSPAAESDTSDTSEALQVELDAEKTANAQLEERNKTLSGRIEEVEAELTDSKDAIEKAVQAREAVETELSEARTAADAVKKANADKQDDNVKTSVDLEKKRDAIAKLSVRLGRMRRTSRQLRGAVQVLRKAAAENQTDAAMINQSMAAELEDLKAMRAAELAEMDLIIGALRPMLEVNEGDENTSEKEGDG